MLVLMAQGMNSIVVVGATGLVGREIVQQSLEDPSVDKVTILVRRSSGNLHPKLQEHLVDFERPEEWAKLVFGSTVFSALGTTLKVAGSERAQYRVDHDYQAWVARAARNNGVEVYVLISAAASSARSPLFYSRMKGELEEEVLALGFPRSRILRPGFLDGDRTEVRLAERLALPLVRALPAWKSLAALRAIHVRDVARAARRVALDPTLGARLYGPAELFEIGAKEEPSIGT